MASEGRYTPIDDWYELLGARSPGDVVSKQLERSGEIWEVAVEAVCCGVARFGLGAGDLVTVVTGEKQGSALQRAGSADEVAVGELIHRVVDDKRVAKVDRIGDGYEDL